MTIFDQDPGDKQTAADFRPAPDRIETGFGVLDFDLEAFPTPQTAQRLYDELDLQRATQAYMDFNPALSVYCIVKSHIRDFGFSTSSDVVVAAGPGWAPSELFLTGNNATVYACASLDLAVDGPTVVEIPPGMMGTANDARFEFLVDFGFVGPDQGEGGKYLFLPPGHDGDVPDGYLPMLSRSHRIWVMMRGFGEVGSGQQAVDWFEQHLRIAPLSDPSRRGTFVNGTGVGTNSLVPEDGTAFELLDEIVQHEPPELFGAEQLGRLATLGIRKGHPFAPDDRLRSILDRGAKQGAAMCRAIVYASREPDIRYWADRHWERMFLHNTTFEGEGINEIDARTLWHYQAIVVSPNLISTTPGAGTAYLTTFRDSEDRFLDGGRHYVLRVPADPPVERFWAISAYDPTTRSLLDVGGNTNTSVGSLDDPEVNADGTVDVHFGPEAPTGKEANWVPTVPGKGFFLVFRFYGPTQAYIDQSWVLNDLERVD